jgi:hypothetical protein
VSLARLGCTQTDRFYRRLFQDILDSLKNDLDLQRSVVARAKSTRPDQKRFLDITLNKMGNQITKTVFNENLSVFRGDTNNKNILLGTPVFDGEKEAYYTRLEIKDG